MTDSLSSASNDENSALLREQRNSYNSYDKCNRGDCDDDSTTRSTVQENVDSISFRIKLVVFCILLTVLGDSITLASVSANVVLFANARLGFTNPQAVTLNFIYSGTRCAFPLLGGYLADAYLGQYNVIYASGLIYIVGVVAIFSITVPYGSPFSNGAKTVFYLLGLLMVAAGSGGKHYDTA